MLKPKLKLFVVSLLLVLYSFTIQIYSGNYFTTNNNINTIHKFSVKTETTADISFHISQNIINLNTFNNLNVPNLEIKFNSIEMYYTNTKVLEKLFISNIKQYILGTTKIILHYRKSAIIFPFHYFW